MVIEALVLSLVLAQCQPSPDNCYRDGSTVWLYYNTVPCQAWPGYHFEMWARTGWDYGVPSNTCDVEHAFFEWNPNPGMHTYERHLWDLYPVPGADDFYISYAPSIRDTQNEFYLGVRHFHLSEVILDDPYGEPYYWNAGWIVGVALNNDPGDTNPNDMWLGCPHHDAQSQIAAFWFQADDSPVSEACPWDFDDNATVEVSDFLALLAGWGTPENPHGHNVADFLMLLAYWGNCPNT